MSASLSRQVPGSAATRNAAGNTRKAHHQSDTESPKSHYHESLDASATLIDHERHRHRHRHPAPHFR
ncbi:hypothetical protein [Comamonas sp. MYb396]|uniref:hypothetical protein n=1 Tax=Comamonas sp. MYb396 TaxID=2745302 RepID=UPI0030B71CE1